ncbi:MAG: hypothetical protein UT55_C0068G0007 [Candidatus Peregrinibacteria bacterium GW2011_GWE2_39_6]|nr:MAG: hypothetical protein UT36_C0006G0049 [Candidatus Peregrinibacteria bacterium GW2011_GWF2_39_17]KKR24226.1 MAG: hypothetical protein UT55_C0068G0007 [Candidatus Peregrinibacteria bacterium GW2011_GWE2_39_6]HCW32789.1 hypothetical protein [Candidatus Peregrinibacteria bacterium]
MRFRNLKNLFKRPQRALNLPAFTLVELIVGMVIFTIFIGIASTSYLFLSRALRGAVEMRKVYAEARFLVDKVTQDIRRYTIDYDCYEDGADGRPDYSSNLLECLGIQLGPQNTYTDTLVLISANGLTRTVYKFKNGSFSVLELVRDSVASSWIMAPGYARGFQVFQTDKVQLTKIQFVVSPVKSPYTYAESSNQYQPSVNMMIQAKGISSLLDLDKSQIQLQTTVSSRVYSVNFK